MALKMVFWVVLPHHDFHTQLRQLAPLSETGLTETLCRQYHSILEAAGNPLSPDCMRRNIALTYTLILPQLKLGAIPRCMLLSAPPEAKRSWIRLIAACSDIPAHDYTARDTTAPSPRMSQTLCTKCTMHEVANEQHVLLRCPTTAAARQGFRDVLPLDASLTTMVTRHSVMQRSRAPFFVHRCVQMYNAAPSLAPQPPDPIPTLPQPTPIDRDTPATTSPAHESAQPAESTGSDTFWESMPILERAEYMQSGQHFVRNHIPSNLHRRTRVILEIETDD